MKGDPKVIEYLNRALRSELTAINQYWLHYRLQADWGVGKLAKKSREESVEEMHHADPPKDAYFIPNQIVDLVPNVLDPDVVDPLVDEPVEGLHVPPVPGVVHPAGELVGAVVDLRQRANAEPALVARRHTVIEVEEVALRAYAAVPRGGRVRGRRRLCGAASVAGRARGRGDEEQNDAGQQVQTRKHDKPTHR